MEVLPEWISLAAVMLRKESVKTERTMGGGVVVCCFVVRRVPNTGGNPREAIAKGIYFRLLLR